jgi:hypothetical protein
MAMKNICTCDSGWQEEVKQGMDNREKFLLSTKDLEWDPNSDKPLHIAKWVYGSLVPSWLVARLAYSGIDLGSYAGAAGSSDDLDGGEKDAIAGASGLMLVGAGMMVLAFLDPEPTSKLGALIVGGVCCLVGGGMILAAVLLTRKNYRWKKKFNPTTGEMEFEAEPCDGAAE